LLFELLELGLPVNGYLQRAGGLAFDMLNSEDEDVTTGHLDGVITLDLAESDDAQREKMRSEMGEPYRTLLGHLRHEIGPYYEPILCPEGSAYATMHPFEDWAETFVHYLHIRDALQTAIAYGVTVTGPVISTSEPAPLHSFPAASTDGIQGLRDAWLPMTYALNALNRSLGADDIYPFVLAPAVIEKLGFTHQLITHRAP
jgi:hypothetical protein